jgi:serine/threonine protein phosphatase PrpC
LKILSYDGRMEIVAWGQTDVGLKREANQDSILVDNKLRLFVIADGMGGHKGGEVASAMAVEIAHEVVEAAWDDSNGANLDPREIIQKAFLAATSKIHLKANVETPELNGMGTTMVLVWVNKNQVYVANVGDSRAYVLSEKVLWQLTEDHSLVNEQIRAGADPNGKEVLAGKNVITRSVGFEPTVSVDIWTRELCAGEIYLLCSDGLCGLVNNPRIQELCASRDPRQIVQSCIEEAKDNGGDDNISVIAFRVDTQ